MSKTYDESVYELARMVQSTIEDYLSTLKDDGTYSARLSALGPISTWVKRGTRGDNRRFSCWYNHDACQFFVATWERNRLVGTGGGDTIERAAAECCNDMMRDPEGPRGSVGALARDLAESRRKG